MTDGGRSDRLKEESLPTCSSFFKEREQKVTSSQGKKNVIVIQQAGL